MSSKKGELYGKDWRERDFAWRQRIDHEKDNYLQSLQAGLDMGKLRQVRVSQDAFSKIADLSNPMEAAK